MKIEISIEKDSEKESKGMPKATSAMQRKVAMMLAKMNGRKKPNEMDLKKAAELEDEENED